VPSFPDIADLFSVLKNAQPVQIRVVQIGTAVEPVSYHWDTTPMPPDIARVVVSKEEAEQPVDYILGLK